MTATLVFEQALNGLQFGLMLFLLAAGLTLVFGIMDMINLAHGSFYMLGAFMAASIANVSGSFWLAVFLAVPITAVIGMLLEMSLLRVLYTRDHLSQVLATFALVLIINEVVRLVWGTDASLSPPQSLANPVELYEGLSYSAYRLAIVVLGLIVASCLYLLIAKTRFGMRLRAGASNRTMAYMMGGDVSRLFTLVFGLGAGLAALAGAALGPILAVQVGMGESILILTFVVIVIGGVGSIRGALIGAVLVGMIDTMGRVFIPMFLRLTMPSHYSSDVGPALASILIYVLMAAVLYWKPQGLFPARNG